jgi:hypothetical protein
VVYDMNGTTGVIVVFEAPGVADAGRAEGVSKELRQLGYNETREPRDRPTGVDESDEGPAAD